MRLASLTPISACKNTVSQVIITDFWDSCKTVVMREDLGANPLANGEEWAVSSCQLARYSPLVWHLLAVTPNRHRTNLIRWRTQKWSRTTGRTHNKGAIYSHMVLKKEGTVECRPVVFSGLFLWGLLHMVSERWKKAPEKGVKNKGAESFSEAAKTTFLQSTLSKLKGNAEHTAHSGVVCLKSQTALINVFIFIANSMINLLFFLPAILLFSFFLF